jgi:sugar diacid utilization regulator
MSIAATSHVVRLHANSVTYRLGRWTDLTGMDPRTFSGLVESVIACRRATSA